MVMLTWPWNESCFSMGTWDLHRAGKVLCRCGQCFPVKGYESFWPVLAATARGILKLGIFPKMQQANTPYSHLLVVEFPEVCSPPCLRHVSQHTMKYLTELPVSLHCLEWKPLPCQKSQMPTFQGGWDTSGLQNLHYAEKSPCVMKPQLLQLWSWVILKARSIPLSFVN